MNLTLTFATRYNGVSLTVDSDDIEVTAEMDEVLDEVSETLPEKTYDMVEKFDTSLTEEQIDELIADAKEIIKDVIPDSNITFEYDDYSS